jgi:UDP-glucose 4-epimerase
VGYEDMARRVPDLTKIKKYTNWTPRINLDKIILDVANYELQRNLAHP